jgi:hypothetical protein
MVSELVFSDTFADWKTKINALVQDHIASTQEFDDYVANLAITGPFTYNRATTSGLSISIYGGTVRNGSVVEFLTDSIVIMPANSTRVLAIYKVDNFAPSLQLYATNAVPEKNVLPIAIFTTDSTQLTNYTDLRTQFSMSSGSAGSASSVLQFDKNIDLDVTIPATKNGLSIDPVVSPGITVTVSPGAVWVVL